MNVPPLSIPSMARLPKNTSHEMTTAARTVPLETGMSRYAGPVPATALRGTRSVGAPNACSNPRNGMYSPKGTLCTFSYLDTTWPSAVITTWALMKWSFGASSVTPTANGAPMRRPFAAPAWATKIVVEAEVTPGIWDQVTDFAITVYDPDAPTGSGWWHWTVVNIPATVTSLAAGASSAASALPKGAVQGRTDFGKPGYGGPCPPKGDRPHKYVFTVWALKVDKLDLNGEASGAMVGYNLNGNKLATATFTARYGR